MAKSNEACLFSVQLISGRTIVFPSHSLIDYYQNLETKNEQVLTISFVKFLNHYSADQLLDINKSDDVINDINYVFVLCPLPTVNYDDKPVLNISKLKQSHPQTNIIVEILNFFCRGEKVFSVEDDEVISDTKTENQMELTIYFINGDTLTLTVEKTFDVYSTSKKGFLHIKQNEAYAYIVRIDQINFIEIKDL